MVHAGFRRDLSSARKPVASLRVTIRPDDGRRPIRKAENADLDEDAEGVSRIGPSRPGIAEQDCLFGQAPGKLHEPSIAATTGMPSTDHGCETAASDLPSTQSGNPNAARSDG